MQLWRPESESDGMNSGSWYHCLPIGISLIRRGRLYSNCVRSSMLHGSETWPVSRDVVSDVSVSRRSFQTSRSRLGLVETWEGLGLDLVSD